MRDVIIKLIEQGKTKSQICEQLEITQSEFNSYLSVHQP